jgi:gluconate 2-dehydrogenase gamma chain
MTISGLDCVPNLHRRQLLATAAYFAMAEGARATVISRILPWSPNAATPPARVVQGPWKFFNWAEGAAAEALADCIIPPDPEFVGGKEAGCAVFVDRQLAGPYGRNEGLYEAGPFRVGLKSQGLQARDGPAEIWRKGLAALDRACRAQHGKSFVELSGSDKDTFLHGLEQGSAALGGVDGKAFFKQIVKDVQQGFFADPVYGGNKDMVSWRMIGFPGTRYDYRDWVDKHNQRFPLPPVSLEGRAEWIERGS